MDDADWRGRVERETCAGEGGAHSLHAAAAALLHDAVGGRCTCGR
jgi:hypothetical protein